MKQIIALKTRSNALRSFTLIEAVISTVIVGIMFVAAMNVLGATAVSKRSTQQQALGYSLAQDLMNEILNQPYEDPTQIAVFGRESAEGGGTRIDFDDVDDYDTWSSIPPEDKNGIALVGYDQWARSVDVSYVKPTGLAIPGTRTGVKSITVTVFRDGIIATQLTALRTQAWPIGRKDPGIVVMFVINSTGILTSQENAKKLLMESWGFKVKSKRASDPQFKFDEAAVKSNVAYVSADVDSAVLGKKLRYTLIGVVSEQADLGFEFGFAGTWTAGNFSDLNIVNISHYITSGFGLGALPIFITSQPGHMLTGPVAPGLLTLGKNADPISLESRRSLAVLRAGDILYGGEIANGRRVRLPWGRPGFDIGKLNKNGRDIMQRSIEWAANKEQP